MAVFRAEKVVSALPSTLEPDTVYFVRTGSGFDIYVSDTTGSVAHRHNQSEASTTEATGSAAQMIFEYDSGAARQAGEAALIFTAGGA